jgi:hypothetical protein
VSDSNDRGLPLTFSSFVISLAGAAMTHLGEGPQPQSGDAEVNLPLARQTIDLIALLKEKTQGNLDDDEKSLIDTLLTELRTNYVAKS